MKTLTMATLMASVVLTACSVTRMQEANVNSAHVDPISPEVQNRTNYLKIAMMQGGEAVSLRFIAKDANGRVRCLTNKALEPYAKPENFVAWDDCVSNVQDSKHARQIWWIEKLSETVMNPNVVYNIDTTNNKRHYLRATYRQINGENILALGLRIENVSAEDIALAEADTSTHFDTFDYLNMNNPAVYVLQQIGFHPYKPYCAAKDLEKLQLNGIETDYKVEYSSASDNCANITYDILYEI